jgi:hypothetical protein
MSYSQWSNAKPFPELTWTARFTAMMGDMTTADRTFRFGVVAAMAPDAQAWTKLAQRSVPRPP